ncbi:MAG: 7-cyano-7-deazaguanine synthase QueC [Lentisphaerae bacterium]|nr:7-cyano-7-deazaguanine synthase QueC [Lentisphaerota bacterium]
MATDANRLFEDCRGITSAVCLLSGGVDSTTLLHGLRAAGVRDLHALSFIYGQRHVRELDMARYQAGLARVSRHDVIDISFLGALTAGRTALAADGPPVPDLSELSESQRRQPPTYVPHRNLLFLAMASAAAEGAGLTEVFYGAQAQDDYGYWDCTREFVVRLNATLGLNRDRPVTIHAPFVGLAKAEVVKIGLALGVDYQHTWTCYRGGKTACGTCPSCMERAAAFRGAGVSDPLAAAR